VTAEGLDHPDLPGLAAAMRAAWRAETEAATDDAAAQWRHGRTLEDWLRDRMHAGDRVAVTIGGPRFAGLVAETGPDLLALRAVFGRVDVHLVPGLPVFVELVDHPPSGGSRAKTRRSFRDALLERDGRSDLSVGTVHDLDGLDGTLHVGHDFVSVVARRGAETVVPLGSVVCVAPRRE
jgi:hypothetical protein